VRSLDHGGEHCTLIGGVRDLLRGEDLLNRPAVAAALDTGQHGLALRCQPQGCGLAGTRVRFPSSGVGLPSSVVGLHEEQDGDRGDHDGHGQDTSQDA
jgi:hypothetical protein